MVSQRELGAVLFCAASFVLLSIGVSCGDKKKSSSSSSGSGGSGGTGGSTTAISGSGGTAASSLGGTSSNSGGGDTSRGSGGTGDGSGGTEAADGGMAGQAGAAAVEPPPSEAGYLDLDPYFFRGGPELDGLTTSSARLFYSFVEAESAPEDRPVFVFTGGATDLSADNLIPGPATSGLFSSFGVSFRTLDADDPTSAPQANPNRWTDLGNLVFIDSRLSGFSYSTLEDPADDGARGGEFASDNFNVFVDAADLVRGVLAFLSDHPDLEDNPVVLVGEGYAGVRLGLALGYLLNPERLRYGSGWDYTDEDLADAILDHYAEVFGDDAITPELAATQFGWQVQIQPKIGGDQLGLTADLWCQPGTPEQEAADELGEECPPLSRDPLNLDRDAGWSLMLRQASRDTLTTPSGFSELLFVDPTDVRGMPAEDRVNAFRLSIQLAVEDLFPAAPSDWIDALGDLPAHDRYYIGDAEQLIAGNSNFADGNDLACMTFIETAQYVSTFITNAKLDGIIRTEALAATLEDCSTWATTPLIDSVDSDTRERDGVPRPGWLTLRYNDDADIGSTTRTIRWPTYESAGHLVSASAPAELKQDVRAFLADSGLELGDDN